MRLMPNIKLTEEEFRKILIHYKICSGGEGTVCDSGKYGTVYKLFEDHGKPKPMGDNKEKKVVDLYHRRLSYSTIPLSTISLNDVIVGYEMTTDYDFEKFKLIQLSREEILQFLIRSKEVLQYFTSKGIIYGDVEPRNILFNRMTGEVMFCDMDNVQTARRPMDRLPYQLISYDSLRGIDYDVPALMHNHMTLAAFDLDSYCSTKYSLKKFFKRGAIKVVNSMKNFNEFEGEYLVDYLKKCK